MKKKLTIIFLVLVWNLNAQIEDLRFRRYTMEDGLAYNRTNCVFQDSRGYIWIGTEQGLSRFDGLEFKNYFHRIGDSTSLSENRVNALFEDSLGYLWISTREGGLNRFDPRTETFKSYLHDPTNPSSIPENTLRHIAPDPEKNGIWIGLLNGGLCFFDREAECFEHYLPPSEQEGRANPINFIQQDIANENRLWLAGKRRLWEFDKRTNQFTSRLSIEEPLIVNIQAIFMPNEEELWLNSWGRGLVYFHIPTQQYTCHYPSPQARHSAVNVVESVLPKSDSELWVSDFSGKGFGVFSKETGTFRFLTPDPADPFSIQSNSTLKLFRDKQNIIWITNHKENGVELLDPAINRIKNVTLPDFPGRIWPMKPEVGCFLYDPDSGQLLVGGYDTGGLLIFDRQMNPHWIPWPFHSTRSGKIFPFLFRDQKGTIWTAEGSDLFQIDLQKRTYVRVLADKLPPNTGAIRQMYQDRESQYWIVAASGLLRYDADRDTILAYPRPDEPSHSKMSKHQIADLLEDREGNLWLILRFGGLAKLDLRQGTASYYNVASGHLVSDIVADMCLDNAGKLWVGHNSFGVQVIDPETGATLQHFSRENGLPVDNIVAMAKAQDGKIWMGTTYGLSCFDPGTATLRTFGLEEGLSPLFVSTVYPAPNGYIFAGGTQQFSYFHPDSLGGNTQPPALVFQSFKVNNQELSLDPGIDYQSSIALSHHQNLISIGFAALNYSNPQNNQYQFMLEGAETDWQFTGGRNRTATYSHLRPGHYTFRLRGANNDGLWNQEERRLKIYIAPPWWATKAAYLTYLLTGLSLLYGLFRFQLRRRLAEVEAARLRELDAYKTNLYTNITHEFRTPLTVIMGMTDQIRGQEKVRQLIRRNSQALLHLVNQLLDLRKLEAGALKLNRIQGDVIPFVEYIMESFSSSAQEKGIALSLETGLSDLMMDFDPERLRQIISNLLSNALKFTEPGGEIQLKVYHRENNLQLMVADTGIGIPAAELPHIFSRFYQVDSTATRKAEGTGIGLALTKELVETMNGELSVESEVGRGSVFTVVLPVTRVAPLSTPPAPSPVPTIAFTDQDTPGSPPPRPDAPLALIVEDNKDVADYLSSCIREGYQIVFAENGRVGLEKALEYVPDIIISDVMMPEMNGFELCRTLKTDERTSHIPIILLTARAAREDRLEGLEQGADAYLAKPFDQDELEIRLRKLVDLRKQLREKYRNADLKELPRPIVDDPEWNFLHRLQQVILENLANEAFKVEPHLCQAMTMSRPQLYRKLKALKDISPSDFIRDIRLQEARRLIIQTTLPISEIADRVGFKDPSYFTRSYSAAFGENPSETRQA
jgi:signal transduction histidine kinase/CheY-like chemotaxis protein/ligand-binding sensor domain-containing protein